MRNPLPNRRASETIRFDHAGIRYFATFGRAAEPVPGGGFVFGPVLEVFLQGGKAGSAIEAVARDSAVAVSLALQHGCPMQVLQHSVTRLDNGAAAGPMGMALDEVAKALAADEVAA